MFDVVQAKKGTPMAQRKTTYRVDSSDVQGEGSWIELSFITRAESRAAKGDSWADDMLKDHVVAWDWVDSEGNEMDVADLDSLFQHEREFIIGKLFNPDEDALKNSGSG